MRSRRRASFHLVAAVLLVTVAMGPLVSVCSGWSPVGAERMACCKSANHGDASARAADECCAAGEERQNVSSQVPFVLHAASASPLAHPAAVPQTGWMVRTTPGYPHPPSYLLGSAFLI